MDRNVKKYAPVTLLKALIAGRSVQIGDTQYCLAGDVLDLAVVATKDVSILTACSFRQFLELGRTMNQKELNDIREYS